MGEIRKMKNIVISCDENYILPTRVLLRSMSTSNDDIKVWFVFSRVSAAGIELLREDTQGYGWAFEARKLDQEYEQLFAGFPVNLHFSKEMYYRLLLPWILPECGRALYLDSDMIVRGDLTPMYQMDLGDDLLAAVLDSWPAGRRQAVKRLELQDDYYNSGVQLLALDRIRKRYTVEAFLQKVKELQETYELEYPDQDLLNKLYDGKIRELDERYNYAATRYVVERLVPKYSLRRRVIIAHFLAKRKPWHKNYFGYYRKEYRELLKEFRED